LAAIIDGTGPHDATVTALAQAVPIDGTDVLLGNSPPTAADDWLAPITGWLSV
jgi:hypothetical protein